MVARPTNRAPPAASRDRGTSAQHYVTMTPERSAKARFCLGELSAKKEEIRSSCADRQTLTVRSPAGLEQQQKSTPCLSEPSGAKDQRRRALPLVAARDRLLHCVLPRALCDVLGTPYRGQEHEMPFRAFKATKPQPAVEVLLGFLFNLRFGQERRNRSAGKS